MSTPEPTPNSPCSQIHPKKNSRSIMEEHDTNFITTNQLGLGIFFTAGIGYLIKRNLKQKLPKPVQADKSQGFHNSKNDHTRHSGWQVTILFLKLVLPLLVSSDKAPTQVRVVSASNDSKQLPKQPQAQPAPQFAHIERGSYLQQAWRLTKAAINAWVDDFAPSMGAAIAYYTIFSIAPMLVIAIAVAGAIFGQDAAQGEIFAQLRGVIGAEGAVAIQGLLQSVNKPAQGLVATGISIVTLIIGSTAVFAELQNALDRIWRMPAAVKKSGVWNLLRTRLLSFGLILGLGFMLMVSLVVSSALAALGKWWSGWFEGWQIVLQIVNLGLSFFVFAALFAVIYKLMPRVSLSWHDVRVGAVTTTVLFIIGKYLIGLYLGTTGMSSGFGAAGSLALLLAWIYYSAQIFLLGAEFTWIYANNFGSKAKNG